MKGHGNLGVSFCANMTLARWNLFGKKIAETINTLTQMGADAVCRCRQLCQPGKLPVL
jgi:hypothetical protein